MEPFSHRRSPSLRPSAPSLRPPTPILLPRAPRLEPLSPIRPTFWPLSWAGGAYTWARFTDHLPDLLVANVIVVFHVSMRRGYSHWQSCHYKIKKTNSSFHLIVLCCLLLKHHTREDDERRHETVAKGDVTCSRHLN